MCQRLTRLANRGSEGPNEVGIIDGPVRQRGPASGTLGTAAGPLNLLGASWTTAHLPKPAHGSSSRPRSCGSSVLMVLDVLV